MDSVKQVGIFDPNNRSNLSISIESDELPDDRPPPGPPPVSVLPLPVTIVLSPLVWNCHPANFMATCTTSLLSKSQSCEGYQSTAQHSHIHWMLSH